MREQNQRAHDEEAEQTLRTRQQIRREHVKRQNTLDSDANNKSKRVASGLNDSNVDGDSKSSNLVVGSSSGNSNASDRYVDGNVVPKFVLAVSG